MDRELYDQFAHGFAAFAARHDLADWEGWYGAYDPQTYAFVAAQVRPDDVVLEIGAGDCALACRLAATARAVYAIEVNPRRVARALQILGYALPRNLRVLCANALDYPFPADVSVAVLLMRHCQHFARYVTKLRAIGCRRLITNARWRLGVEVVDLDAAIPWSAAGGGWYACQCGMVGYRQGPAPASDGVTEVASCPACHAPP